MNSVTPFNGSEIDINSTADGLPYSETLGESGDTIATSYDNTDNPSQITLTSGSTTLQQFSYSDEPSGSVASETDTPASSEEPADYAYDAQDRVTLMTPGSGSSLDYGYDPSGNATTLPTGATGSYNDASELTSSSQGGTTTSYAYNADGERTQEAAGGTTTMAASYNGVQELASYDDAAADMSSATYDGDGLRQSAFIAGSSETFTWDVSGTLPRLLMDSTNAYVYGPGDTPIKEINLSAGTVHYLVSDQLGSVRGIVDSTGDLDASTSYDAWGNPETAGGLSSYTPFGYAGGYTDPTGLSYLINRYYDPTTGQFLSVDPLVGETDQPYQYTGDDPINDTDPSGQFPCVSLHCFTDTVSSGYNTVKGVVTSGYNTAKGVVTAGASWVGRHKAVAGVALGVTAFVTGGLSLAAEGTAAVALGFGSVATGGAATALDLQSCLNHVGPTAACVASALGLAATGGALPELGVAAKLWNEGPAGWKLLTGFAGVYAGSWSTLIDIVAAQSQAQSRGYATQDPCSFQS
jgi:RHS repeat-associated protein